MPSENVKLVNVNNEYVDANDTDQYSANDIPTIDLRLGGQWGLLPRIGGVSAEKPIHEWMHEQAYLKRDIIPIVLEVPRMFDLMPNSKDWKEAIKAMLEVHAKTIDGLNSSLTVDTTEHELGLSGATFKEISDVKREATSVSITLQEKYGIPFEILLDVWIRYGMMDPDLKAPLITRIASADQLPKAWTADWYSMSAIFIEPDVMYRKPIHSWLVSNMFPTSNPDIIGKKDKNSGRELKEISLELGGFAVPHTNKRVHKLATATIEQLELWSKDPEEILLPVESVDPSIASTPDEAIYYEGVKSAADVK